MARRTTEAKAEGAAAQTPGGSGAPANKTEAVRLALAEGVTSPQKIAGHVKDKYGLDITPAHASTIKGTLKRKKGKGKGKARGKPGRKPNHQQAAVATSAHAPPAKRVAAASGSGLTSQDLAALAEIAERVGGIDRLQEFLAALRRLR
jgi:hypothetical protein